MKEKREQKSRSMKWEMPRLSDLSRGAWSAAAGLCKGGSADAEGCVSGYLGPKYKV